MKKCPSCRAEVKKVGTGVWYCYKCESVLIADDLKTAYPEPKRRTYGARKIVS